jgi:NADH pyrophosphatase NudC (nudix superfamily)
VRDYRYCPRCRHPLVRVVEEPDNPYVRCDECGFTKWDNPLPSTIGLVERDGRVLLLERAVAPGRGQWDAVGGFLAPHESAEACLAREADEELGQDVLIGECLGTYPSVYGETGLTTVGIAFRCTLTSDDVRLSAENTAWAWFGLDDLPSIAFADVAAALDALRGHTSTT